MNSSINLTHSEFLEYCQQKIIPATLKERINEKADRGNIENMCTIFHPGFAHWIFLKTNGIIFILIKK